MLEADRQRIRSELSSKTKEELVDLLMKEVLENDALKAREAENEKVFTRMSKDYAREKERSTRLEKENRVLKEQNAHLAGIRDLQAKNLFGRSTEKAGTISGEEAPCDPLSEDMGRNTPSGDEAEEDAASSNKGILSSGQCGNARSGRPSGGKKRSGRKSPDLSHLPHHTTYDFSAEDIDSLNREYGEGNWVIKLWRHHVKVERLRPLTYVEETYEPIIAHGDQNDLVALPYPEDILPGSILSNSLAASLMYGKFGMGLPFQRQIRDMETDGLYLTEQKVTFWAGILASRYLKPVYEFMTRLLKSRPYNQCDETTELVLRDGRAAGSRSFIWVHVTSEFDESPAVVVFCYEKTRAAQHLRDFYGTGSLMRVLTCDAYSAYQTYEKEMDGSLIVTGCWMHLRRRFFNALTLASNKGVGREQTNGLPESKALELIGEIYREEGQLKTLTAGERLKQRQKKILPLVDRYFEFVHSFDMEDPSLSERFRDALGYSLNQECYLRRFLDDGEIPIDNGFTERRIRPFAVGRRNWLFNCTPKGAEAAMMYYTVIETAKLNGANPYIYLKFLFEEMPRQAPFFADSRALMDVMPWSGKYRQYEKEDFASTVEKYLPPDDERPASPGKVGKKARKHTAA